jgi:hypothetical protein
MRGPAPRPAADPSTFPARPPLFGPRTRRPAPGASAAPRSPAPPPILARALPPRPRGSVAVTFTVAPPANTSAPNEDGAGPDDYELLVQLRGVRGRARL